jgi:hypothetical protein
VEQLASDYAGQRVVFLEQDVDSPIGSRYSRWWAAYGSGGSVTLPLVMADSGNQISNGSVDFYDTYKAMIDAELARPAQMEIQASTQRVGDTLYFDIELKNLSGVTLGSSNSATVHAIVYEDAHVIHTDRIVRAADQTIISPALAPGATKTLTLETALSGVDWDKIHPIVLVDYRPGGSSGAYDMLQAALASAAFDVHPSALTFLVDPTDSTSPSTSISLEGPSTLTWTATIDTSWLTITPTSGIVTIQPTVSVVTSTLSPGWQQGLITFTTILSDAQVPVSAYYGTVLRAYLPVTMK